MIILKKEIFLTWFAFNQFILQCVDLQLRRVNQSITKLEQQLQQVYASAFFFLRTHDIFAIRMALGMRGFVEHIFVCFLSNNGSLPRSLSAQRILKQMIYRLSLVRRMMRFVDKYFILFTDNRWWWYLRFYDFVEVDIEEFANGSLYLLLVHKNGSHYRLPFYP